MIKFIKEKIFKIINGNKLSILCNFLRFLKLVILQFVRKNKVMQKIIKIIEQNKQTNSCFSFANKLDKEKKENSEKELKK